MSLINENPWWLTYTIKNMLVPRQRGLLIEGLD